MGGFGIDWYINVTNNACFSQNQLTVSMGNPKIHIPQNCKVKLVYLREQLKASSSFTLKKVLDFICLRRLCSVSFSYRTCHVRIQPESVTPKHRPRSVQTVQTEATSTLNRINLKTQLLPRKRIKCSPSTLIVFKLFRCP